MSTPSNKIVFDKTINLGHILTFASFLLVAVVQWGVMDKRVVILEEFRIAQRERDTNQDYMSKEKFQEVRDALVYLRVSVDKVADNLANRAHK